MSASKEAVKLAEEYGIDLAKIKGTGKEGSVTIADVRKVVKAMKDSEAKEDDGNEIFDRPKKMTKDGETKMASCSRVVDELKKAGWE